MTADCANSCDERCVIMCDHKALKYGKWDGHFLSGEALSPQTSDTLRHSQRVGITYSYSLRYISNINLSL